MNLLDFQNKPFIEAIQSFFKNLNIPVNEIATAPAKPSEIIGDNYLNILINEVYAYGIINDAIFEQNETTTTLEEIKSFQSNYDGILLFGIVLNPRENGLLPTRNQLSDITRAFNRTFKFTPVTIIFKYDKLIALANTERTQYKQTWREGEKVGKVSLLRDIDYNNVHSGHERILNNLGITRNGKYAIVNFEGLYKYWQEVLSVSLLNKQFYKELQDWYFWAIKNVVFPNSPTITDAHTKNIKFEDLVQEHKATNVIRLLTRLLFVWFIKEKKLIPDELFELENLQKDILKEISPYHETGMFKENNRDSVYYKSILQNLFFATLNCPIKSDSIDKRQRGFRGEGYGTHRGIDYLMRYKDYFKDPDKFLEILNGKVPFLNGGLFECLDDKYNNVYIDGFSDQMTKSEKLIVPDYLFFGLEEKVDLSAEYGIVNKGTKEAAVKGLINILKSYKFTITENTPIEEDVALDPELLGKVFENLLASYNPETKTTARKQTGSFYTPREIVDYMVEESLVAYLKNNLKHNFSDEQIDIKLRELTSFNESVPFLENKSLQEDIIIALSNCKILDPACGSGAYPMGILQKMVHVLKKLDPNNEKWKEVQRQKVITDTQEAFEIEDKQTREELLIEINNAFDQDINDADYARKLYLIENCIYGVDIQAIATQISKLRFFISLVVEQKENNKKENFGIRPLPNLETKFVAANTLIGIDKKTDLFDIEIIRNLEKELKTVRHKLFSVKTKETKLKYRELDATLRKKIADELVNNGWPDETAEKLSGWNPYDQNATSPFYDTEWMFGLPKINGGFFDIVIGNPPYVKVQNIQKTQTDYFKKTFESAKGKYDMYVLFIENSIKTLIKENGQVVFINPHRFMIAEYGFGIRNFLITQKAINRILVFGVEQVFDAATTYTGIFFFSINSKNVGFCETDNLELNDLNFEYYDFSSIGVVWNFKNEHGTNLLQKLTSHRIVKNIFKGIFQGLISMGDDIQMLEGKIIGEKFIGFSKRLQKNVEIESSLMRPILKGENIQRYSELKTNIYVFYPHIENEKNKTIPIDEVSLKSKFPLGYSYISNFKNELEVKKIKYKTNPKYWYSLHRSRELNLFNSEKIITPQLQNKSSFTIDKNAYFPDAGGYMLIKKENDSIDLKVYLAIFNSNLFYYFIRQTSTPYNNNYYYFKTNYIEPFSIPFINETFQNSIIPIVEEITLLKQNEANTSLLENKINKLVYELYELTEAEIATIEL